MCTSGRVSTSLNVCVHQALAPTKIPKPHHATRNSRLEPVSPTFPHVPTTFRNGSFFCFRCLRWHGPWHNSLEFTALGMDRKDLQQFPAIFSDFRCTNLYNPSSSGHSSLDFWIIECMKNPGICSINSFKFAVFWGPECMGSRKL